MKLHALLSRIFQIVVLFAVAFATVGCGALPGAPQLPSPSQSGVLFGDDFSNPSSSSGWGRWGKDGAMIDYHNGGLRILVQQPNYDFWSVAGKDFGDIKIEADVVKIGGPDDNDFGLICRYVNAQNFYMLVISSDGYYGIAKVKDGQYSMISANQLQFSSAIAQGRGANHLSASCAGDTLSLDVNGQALASVEDADFVSGDVGFIAGAYDTPGVDVLFDNLVVTEVK